MQNAAISEYRNNNASEEKGFKVSYSKGYTQCFCNAKMELGDDFDAVYEANDGTEVAVCEDYQNAQHTTMILTNGLTVAIVAINTILKKAIIALITWIGYDTNSMLMTKITNGVFMCLFFNTGILLLLTSANFGDVSGFLSVPFHGTYYDYSPRWYAMVGATIVSTMQLNAFMPPIFEGIDNSVAWLMKTLDNGCRCCQPKEERMYHTKTSQIFKYMEIHGGRNYIVHFKFSGILNICFVTMMYGLGLPQLFPIAVLSMFIIYCTERY